MAELSDEAKRLIRRHMITLVAIPGALLSIVSAIAGYVIHGVGQREAYIESFREFSAPVIEAAQEVSAAKATVEFLNTKINEDASRIEDIRKRVDANEALADLDKTVDAIADRLSALPDFRERVVQATSGRISKIESELKSVDAEVRGLGSDRSGKKLTVNNPSIGGADSATCPKGTFVSAIHASKGVSGKYGVDGISEITFTCSPIRK